ncbi:glyoxylate reductase [candidate division WOR_3 bacterium SM23_60]|uniref:Glyoxylate reductase n=1 Tax=candidate division WOR_3 bacterium SM23_60 TaxID=1703780 RepID=A0A0S8GF56_UNCW3|nr:MAG: glyoxylate reductase [candidate division WOR_3 bacterium SM23_60]
MKKPKVLITRTLPQPGMDVLAQQCDLEVYDKHETMPRPRLIERVGDKAGLICLLSDRIDKEIVRAGTNLKIIANYAVGHNNIDTAEAAKRNIYVTNTPGVLTDTTADLAFALLTAVARRIPEADQYVRAGRFRGWEPMLMLGTDVHGATLGIIGFGRIGRALARRARGFDMKVLYYEPERLSATVEKQYRAEYRILDDLLRESDFVSVHVPLTESTHHLIARPQLALMKKSAFLINTSRGPVVDERALVTALQHDDIAGCALDVFEHEPAVEQQLKTMTNVVLAPHIGSASVQTRTQMALMVAHDVIAVLVHGKAPAHIVSPKVLKGP